MGGHFAILLPFGHYDPFKGLIHMCFFLFHHHLKAFIVKSQLRFTKGIHAPMVRIVRVRIMATGRGIASKQMKSMVLNHNRR